VRAVSVGRWTADAGRDKISRVPSFADFLVSELRAAGVRMLFGVPGGGGNLDIIDAARRGGLPFVLTHTETGGALMACAQAEITGAAAACLCTLGPGTSSVVNGVAHASLDRVPLLVFTDRHPETAADCLHQRFDHASVLAPLVKHTLRLQADASDTLRAGIACALAPAAGPVHFDCAPEVFAREIPGRAPRTSDSERPEWTSDLGRRTLDNVFPASRRPLVIAGLGAATPDAARAVRAFCERHTIPALVTYKAKGVLPDDSPLFAGVFTNGAIERPIIERADLLIGIGLDPVELLPRPWNFSATIIGCGWPIPDQRHIPFVAEYVGPVAETVSQLARDRTFTSEWDVREIAETAARQRAAVCVDAEGLSPSRAIGLAARSVGREARVAIDAGAHMLPAVNLWPVFEPHQLLISNGLSTMGFALPAAIGASLLDRERRAVAVTGDGGLMMCVGELKTAVRERAPVLTLVLNDASLSLIKIKQDKRRLPSAGVTLGDVDWCAMAAGVGMPAWRADDPASLERALGGALSAPGPALIDARVDPGVYPATLQAVRG
jgi:acetolactate synthase-1/2/3 large subunit